MKFAIILFLSCIIALCLIVPEVTSFPLFSWASLAERRHMGWLRPWRWFFARKGSDDGDYEGVDSQTNTQVTATDESAQMSQPMLNLDQFGPGTLMNIGEDLVYVPFSAMKNLNNNPEWVW